ncbi:MAG: DUF1343 domain-containing protein [Fimbriimonadaceae bacterium]
MSAVRTGLDVLVSSEFEPLAGKRLGVVANHASVDRDLVHISRHLARAEKAGKLEVRAYLGPEHGLWGAFDDRVAGEGEVEPHTGKPFISLYGASYEPPSDFLDAVDGVLFDLPDVGSRFYTYTWTLAHVLEGCQKAGKPVWLLDRPNPIGGVEREGPVLEPECASFVGRYPIPIRHGMTLGELGTWMVERFIPGADLRVIGVEGWRRADHWPATGLPWVMPSPAMPLYETAVVYPGMGLLEATNLSEGRGTTRPFEMFGAPYLDGWALADALNAAEMLGVRFRPVQFEPTSGKHREVVCQGCFLHVFDPVAFRPVQTALRVMREVWRQRPAEAAFLPPSQPGGLRRLDTLGGTPRWEAWVSDFDGPPDPWNDESGR